MLSPNKYIKQWKQWINRDKKYTPDELEELETFLLDKIEDLQTTQKLSDKEAFLQALDIMGEQGMLTEEFSKVRQSKFDKVKLWAFLQTFVILALVMVIAAPYVHLPKKDPIKAFIGENIGDMFDWIEETRLRRIERAVAYKQNMYVGFYGNFFCYGAQDYYPKTNYFLGTYLPPKQPSCLQISLFDIDEKNGNLVCCGGCSEGNALIYRNSLLLESFPMPELEDNEKEVGFIVIDNHLLIFVTLQKMKALDPERDPSYHLYGDRIVVDQLISSYVFICDLSQKQKKYEKIVLKNTILAMDHSEDELAMLSETGEINKFAFTNKKLVHLKTWQIENGTSMFPLNRFFDLLFTKKGNQMVIKLWSRKYIYLHPIKDSLLKTFPFTTESVIKKNYYDNERLVMLRKDLWYSPYFSLYLFKE
jgi:hypothetical protein